jgi:hypothetical protein
MPTIESLGKDHVRTGHELLIAVPAPGRRDGASTGPHARRYAGPVVGGVIVVRHPPGSGQHRSTVGHHGE